MPKEKNEGIGGYFVLRDGGETCVIENIKCLIVGTREKLAIPRSEACGLSRREQPPVESVTISLPVGLWKQVDYRLSRSFLDSSHPRPLLHTHLAFSGPRSSNLNSHRTRRQQRPSSCHWALGVRRPKYPGWQIKLNVRGDASCGPQ